TSSAFGANSAMCCTASTFITRVATGSRSHSSTNAFAAATTITSGRASRISRVVAARSVRSTATVPGSCARCEVITTSRSRSAAGDVPYAQFPLAQAPLTFLVQALLIKVLGPHFFVQIAYAAIAGGLATVLTYLIARRLVVGVVASPAALAAVLAIPLVPLG